MKKVAAIQDLSCFGRASLGVSIPIISTMGYQVVPLPTAILSSHSEYPGFRSFDMTAEMPKIIEHWKELSLEFDAIYSGYLATPKQASIVANFIKDFRTAKNFVLIDPVLGDNHTLYPGINNDMVNSMRNLCSLADIITPNFTEAALLLNRQADENISEDEICRWLQDLSSIGPKKIILTSAPSPIKGQVNTLAYDAIEKNVWQVVCKYIPASYPGTGDAFASVIVACHMKGMNIEESVDTAVRFVNRGVERTYKRGGKTIDGMDQEEVLPLLLSKPSISKYKLLRHL